VYGFFGDIFGIFPPSVYSKTAEGVPGWLGLAILIAAETFG
jgi:hypothetical protein